MSILWTIATGVAMFVAGWGAKSMMVERAEDQADDRHADDYDRKHRIGRYADAGR